MKRWTLLGRPHCHLCEDFEAALLDALDGQGEVDQVDVDQHAHWQAEYGLRIPVLLTEDGRFLGEGVFAPAMLAAR